MPKKGGKKGGKKGKKGPTDWGEMPREKWVEVEVRNGAWTSMRFIERLSTTTKISKLVDLIMTRHSIAGTNGLSLYLGEQVDEAAIVRPEEYNLSLADVKVTGGSINDHVLQVITYDYRPHRTADSDTVPPSRNYGILHLPRSLMLPPLRQWGP